VDGVDRLDLLGLFMNSANQHRHTPIQKEMLMAAKQILQRRKINSTTG
jgi:hypothetical protein